MPCVPESPARRPLTAVPASLVSAAVNVARAGAPAATLEREGNDKDGGTSFSGRQHLTFPCRRRQAPRARCLSLVSSDVLSFEGPLALALRGEGPPRRHYPVPPTPLSGRAHCARSGRVRRPDAPAPHLTVRLSRTALRPSSRVSPRPQVHGTRHLLVCIDGFSDTD